MTPAPDRWLVTGGCGFIGRRLIASLREDGARVRVLDDLSVGTREDLAGTAPVQGLTPDWSADGVELVVGDIRDAASVARACEGAEVVVHLAASAGVPKSVEDPGFDHDVNVAGTLQVLMGTRDAGARRLVFASSAAPLGAVEPPVHEDLPTRPMSPYGASKLAGEGYCSAFFHAYGLETVALRFGNVYGPGSGHKTSVVAKWLRRGMEGRALELYGDGSQTRDFVYVDDLVGAIRRSAEAPDVGGRLFQIATARETSVGELADAIRDALEAAGHPRPEVVTEAPRAGDLPRSWADTTRAKEQLGWQARTGLEDGLRKTLEWFDARGPAGTAEQGGD